jgi:hypothetical protein
MDRRRSFYLAFRQDDFDVLAPDEPPVDLTDIPHITPANDNARKKAACRTAAGCSFAV